MHNKWIKTIISLGMALAGFAMIVVAFFAYSLHIDNNPSMGANRIALAWMGSFFLLAALVIQSTTFLRRILDIPFLRKWRFTFNWVK